MASTEAFGLENFGIAHSPSFEEHNQNRVYSRHSQTEEHEHGRVSLPRADGGKDAWWFLAGCFLIEALTWGFPFSFGVFQEYYSTHLPFSKEPSGIAIIGSSAMGIMYLGAPFTFAFLQRYPNCRRQCSVVGLVVVTVALIMSSFSTCVWHLILSQGVLYAIGGSMLYTPAILFLDEWFIIRKGFAFGVMWAGTGVSGVCIPFIMNWGLNKYSFSTMLRAWAVVLVLLLGPLLYYVKPRLPVSSATNARRLNFHFLKTWTFLVLQAGNILQGLGFFIPNIYLPTYARSLGLSPIAGAVTVSLFNTTSVFGQVILGSLIDRFHVTTVVLISTIGATLSVFLLWGLSASLPLLCIFSLVYGLFAGGFTSTYTGIIQEVKKVDNTAEAGLVFGLLAAGRGVGSVVSGPLSEALLNERPWVGEAFAGYGSGYGGLIVFTGVTAMLSGVTVIVLRWEGVLLEDSLPEHTRLPVHRDPVTCRRLHQWWLEDNRLEASRANLCDYQKNLAWQEYSKDPIGFLVNSKYVSFVMPSPAEFKRRHGREAEDKGFELVLICTQSLYKSRKTLTDNCFDHTLRICKRIVRRTLDSEHVRMVIGMNAQHWKDINETFALAIPVLEVQSLASEDPQTATPTSSSALMALNHDILMKDLERLNDILIVARNVLATTVKVQNLAGESLLDQQILKLIDLCVRVTARGYDGDAGSRTEIQWGEVIGSYKKLLITCLQFLYNFIQENEQRKLLLWLDLFANSKVQSEYAAGTLPPGLGRDHFAAKLGGASSKGKVNTEPEKCVKPNLSSSETLSNESNTADNSNEGRTYVPSSKSHEDLLKDIDEITESAEPMERMSINRIADQNEELRDQKENLAPKDINHEPLASTTQKVADNSLITTTHDELLFGAVKTERGDEFGALRTPESAAVTLQAAKDQLMARLADTATVNINDEETDIIPFPNDTESNFQQGALSDDEEEYRSPGEPGDQERGLLTDIPLVLGPQEIEPLPMIIQIAICSGQGAVMHGRDMQGMRCNILLAGDPGRNLLRELLIFIAAWDLQDDEIYFKLMMQIMEAILENGLMPYAYQTFAEVKDIVSPAQSMVIKILTQIFRGKQGLPPITGKDAWTAGNVHANASRRVDIYIVRYIFTIFRQCIIPETCALIYLQGQIKAGLALPDDFPLNLWDMERVYEGVYQFLEFFAVLTESEEWKDLLVNWEIVNELVTLLRELEASIPKAPPSVPQTVAEAQQVAVQQQHQQAQQPQSQAAVQRQSQPTTKTPIPVAVERPFDVAPPLPVIERPFDVPPAADAPFAAPSPLSQTDSQDQVEIDAADPSDFEWRNLKKLVILVLSSLVWKSPKVQKQIRQYGGVEMVLACCTYDGNNPYIREHAVMCLRFLLENNEENKNLVRGLEKVNLKNGQEGSGVLPAETPSHHGQALAGAQAAEVEEEEL